MYMILLATHLPCLSHQLKRTFHSLCPHHSLSNCQAMILSSALFMDCQIALQYCTIVFGTLHYFNQPCLPPCLPLKALHPLTYCHHSVHLESHLLHQYQLHHLIVTHQHCSQKCAQLICLPVAFYSLLMMIQWTSQIRCWYLKMKAIVGIHFCIPQPIYRIQSTGSQMNKGSIWVPSEMVLQNISVGHPLMRTQSSSGNKLPSIGDERVWNSNQISGW